jgi:hypothetical protein
MPVSLIENLEEVKPRGKIVAHSVEPSLLGDQIEIVQLAASPPVSRWRRAAQRMPTILDTSSRAPWVNLDRLAAKYCNKSREILAVS